MAEINVEKKKPVWPWIVGIIAIVIIIILLFIFTGNDDDRETETDDAQIEKIEQYEIEENTNLSYPDNAIGAYLHLIDDGYDERLGEEQDYTRKAMDRLATAVEQKTFDLKDTPSEGLEEIGSRLGEQEQTQEFREARFRTDEIKGNAETIVNSLEELHKKHYPDLSGEIQELREDLDAIEPNTLAEEQSEAITDFFNQAADVLREMPAQTSSITVPYNRSSDTALYSTDVDTIELE